MVEITLPVESLRYFSEKKNDFIVEPGNYEIQIGSSSSDIRMRKTITVAE